MYIISSFLRGNRLYLVPIPSVLNCVIPPKFNHPGYYVADTVINTVVNYIVTCLRHVLIEPMGAEYWEEWEVRQ